MTIDTAHAVRLLAEADEMLDELRSTADRIEDELELLRAARRAEEEAPMDVA